MYKSLGIACAVVVLCGASVTAVAAPLPPTRVRGTISSVTSHAVVLKTYAGHHRSFAVNGKTTFVSVVPGHLDQVKSGEFVGIAATGAKSSLKGLEVVIFPKSMRGAGEGHYPWSMPARVAAADQHQNSGMPAGAPPVQGTMTNGTVTNAAAGTVGPPVQGTMTNGTVKADAQVAGGRKLAITYNDGQHVNITVPADAPVVHLVPASRSIAIVGAKTFVVAVKAGDGKFNAALVAVGKEGLMPPM
ncbi:MAG TPA: hypothetical protein VFQ88_03710 [Nevskiaceae bacterium]|nr:hypothetical protein [Nevskiaceae bacterium]